MSINDPILAKYNLKHGYRRSRSVPRRDWYALRGAETFYDENDSLITFKTEAECVHWIDAYQMNQPIDPLPRELVSSKELKAPIVSQEESPMIRTFIYKVYSRHLNKDHDSPYEVCDSLLCRFAWWIEHTFNIYKRENEW